MSGRNDGYIENDKYVITWCVGHLVEMVYPEEYDEKYKRWRLEDLPFLPEEYKYNVIPDVSKQYDTVHRMLFREDIGNCLLGRRYRKKKDRRLGKYQTLWRGQTGDERTPCLD